MADLAQVVAFCARRGFVFQSSDIYGGLSGCWDYGPAGTDLKRRIEALWWREVVEREPAVVGFDAAILMRPEVWQASGHVENFHDPMVDDRSTQRRYRLDTLLAAQAPAVVEALAAALGAGPLGPEEMAAALAARDDAGELLAAAKVADPKSGKAGDWTGLRQFNLMLSTSVGAMEDSASTAYLRPETAQGIFVNAIAVGRQARLPIPFGLAQVGKAFRNEITPRNFLFRVREFTQMELEVFCHPGDAEALFAEWVAKRLAFYSQTLGVKAAGLHLREHEPGELAHYAVACQDVEYDFPFGRRELEGIANRGTWDMDQHAKESGKNLTLSDPQRGKFTPAVVEASAGLDRTFLCVVCDALDTSDPEHIVLRLHPRLCATEVAIFPLVRKDGMPERAAAIAAALGERFRTRLESSGTIGKRYYREDEAGTPLAVTVDGDTLADGTVTLRDRDTGEQERVAEAELAERLAKRLAEWPA